MPLQKIFRAIGAVAAFAGLAAWWYSSLLEMEAYPNRPRQPQPDMGFTIPHKIKQGIVYISPDDRALNVELFWVLVGSGVILLVASILSGDLWRTINPPPPDRLSERIRTPFDSN